MSASTSRPPISDELLSAYLDGAVTADERVHIEGALLGDPELKWRLESLRQTVLLLRALPAVETRRNFSLKTILAAERGTVDALEDGMQTAMQTGMQTEPDAGLVRPLPPLIAEQEAMASPGAGSSSWWQRLGGFFNSGSPILRNAAMGVAALFVVVAVGVFASDGSSEMMSVATAPASMAPADSAPQASDAVALMQVESPAQADAAHAESAADASANSAARTSAEDGAAEEAAPEAVIVAQSAPESAVAAAAATANTPTESAPTESAPAESAPASVAAVSEDTPVAAAARPATDLPAAGAVLPPSAAPESGGGMGGALQTMPLAEGAPGGPDSTGLDQVMRETQGTQSREAAPAPPMPAAADSERGDLRPEAERAADQASAAGASTALTVSPHTTPVQADVVLGFNAADAETPPAGTTSDSEASAEEPPAEELAATETGGVAAVESTTGPVASETTTEDIALYDTAAESQPEASASEKVAEEVAAVESSLLAVQESEASVPAAPAPTLASVTRPAATASGFGVDNLWLLTEIVLGVLALLLFALWWRSRSV